MCSDEMGAHGPLWRTGSERAAEPLRAEIQIGTWKRCAVYGAVSAHFVAWPHRPRLARYAEELNSTLRC